MSDTGWDDTSFDVVQQLEARLNWIYTRLPYGEYLNTTHWTRTRQLALEHYGTSCQLCGTRERPIHVHHRASWDRSRGNERLTDVTVLCEICHHRYHQQAA